MKKMKLRFLTLLLAVLVGMNGIPLEAVAVEGALPEVSTMDVTSGDIESEAAETEELGSLFTVSVGDADPAMVAAQEKAWAIINEYADPEYHLSDPYWEGKEVVLGGKLTEEEYEKLRRVALEETAECTTQYDKIKAIVEYVAERTYYDVPARDGKGTTYYNPYDVYEQKRAVCQGYANLVRTLLISIDIPCMVLIGYDHEYNAAYDSDNDRWIFADATWCSDNSYTLENGLVERGYSLGYFDLEPKDIAKLSNHEVYEIDGLIDPEAGDFYYCLDANDENWSDMEWNLKVSNFRRTGNLVVGDGFEGLEVTEIGKLMYFNQNGNSTVTEIDLSATAVEAVPLNGWTALEKVELPATVETVNFRGCSSLKEIDLSHTQVTAFEYGEFEECTSLEKVVLPITMKKIGQRAFMYCKALKEVNLSKTQIETIRSYAFFNCSGLERIELPATVTEIGNNALEGCTGVKVLDFSQTQLTTLESEVIPVLNLEVLKLPKTITSATSNAVIKYQREGYFKFWWNTQADGNGTDYNTISEIVNAIVTSGNGITLYTQWQAEGQVPKQYTITYQLNGGTNNKANPESYTEATETITLKNPTRTGYTFAGWYSDSDFTDKVTSISQGSTDNKILYAKWTVNKYKIKFAGNGATGGKMTTVTNRKYDTTYKLSANKYTRKGYKFAGWNTKKNGSGKSYSNKANVKNLTSKNGKTVTLYAQWKPVKYTITYKLNGGKNNNKNPKTYTTATKNITLKKPTRKGYIFVGWYSDKKLTKKVTKIKKGSTGKVTLYAKWKRQ